MRYYPAFLDLRDRVAVVVGGGRVAERKVRSLVKAGSTVKVVSPSITAYLKKLKKEGKIIHKGRNYRRGDLKGAFIVIAATSSTSMNRRVASEAGVLVNVVDPPDAGNFIVPSHFKRGYMTIAISTEGISPAVSKAIRIELEKHYGREFARYLRFVEKIRKKAVQTISDRNRREMFLKSLAEEQLFENIRKRGFNSVSEEILSSLEKLHENY